MEGNPIPTVAIGGISAKNACELIEESSTGELHTDGLAIVSAIMAAEDPKVACKELLTLIRKSFAKVGVKANNTVNEALDFAVQAAKNIKAKTPMVHHITSKSYKLFMQHKENIFIDRQQILDFVVINDNANATLAVGASPIMSTNRQELEELAAVNGAMLLNMGTLNDVDMMISAAQVNARNKNPVVLDPVGCGATTYRKQIIKRFLDECNLTVIKGNAGEILSMAGLGGKSRGVDSVGDNEEQVMVNAIKSLAKQNGNLLRRVHIFHYTHSYLVYRLCHWINRTYGLYL